MQKQIKVLTIKEPWIWLILNRGKDVENRTWKTNYRGRLYLHSSQNFDFNALNKVWEMDKKLCSEIIKVFKIEYNSESKKASCNNKASFGKILGAVDLVDCISNCDSVWAESGQNHWVLENPKLIEKPISCKGKLSIWTLNVD